MYTYDNYHIFFKKNINLLNEINKLTEVKEGKISFGQNNFLKGH